MKKINAEIGTSGEFVDFELTDDAAYDVSSAVRLEHQQRGECPNYCDICAAHEAGFVFSSAHLLLGATETPLLNDVVTHHYDAMYAGESWPVDWDAWTKHFLEFRRECPSCGSFVPREDMSCGNCLTTFIPIECDVRQSIQEVDEDIQCLKINVPQWYEREDFKKWLNKYIQPTELRRHATWHTGGEPNEMSDLFVTYDQGEGSDFEEMPEDCWEEIHRMCRELNVKCAVIWLTNLARSSDGNDGTTDSGSEGDAPAAPESEQGSVAGEEQSPGESG